MTEGGVCLVEAETAQLGRTRVVEQPKACSNGPRCVHGCLTGLVRLLLGPSMDVIWEMSQSKGDVVGMVSDEGSRVMNRLLVTLSLLGLFSVPATAQEARSPDSNNDFACSIRQSQATLTVLGYKLGPVDGIWGLNTANAVQMYQSEQKLPATGILDLETCSHMASLRRSGKADISRFEVSKIPQINTDPNLSDQNWKSQVSAPRGCAWVCAKDRCFVDQAGTSFGKGTSIKITPYPIETKYGWRRYCGPMNKGEIH